jgi:hypothetical protein
MRRLSVAATLCAAVFALAAGTAAAAMPHAPVADRAGQNGGPHAAADGLHARAHFVPLGARLAGSTTVSGTVYDSSHSALGGVEVEWDALVGGNWTYGPGVTDGAGHYQMTANATTNGEVYAHPDMGNSTFGRGGRTWTAGGSDTVDLYPGRISVEAYRGGRWQGAGTDGVTLRLFGETEYSRALVYAASATSNAVGTVDVLDGTYDQGGSVQWFSDEGVEVPGPITITSGATLGGTVTAYEADAQRVWVAKPYWGSGKPGATITIARDNFPAGWRNWVSGHTDDPNQTSYKEYGTKVSRGGAIENLSVKIPSTAKPGYRYTVDLQHVDASGNFLPLSVEEPYQVCTMKPSKASIRKGAKIRVSGVVPTQGHWGSELGVHKKVWVLWHKGTAAVPKGTTNQALKGWYQVGKVLKCTGTGSYSTAYFKPPATGTFVAYYDADEWYWGAYTSTAKVTVR